MNEFVQPRDEEEVGESRVLGEGKVNFDGTSRGNSPASCITVQPTQSMGVCCALPEAPDGASRREAVQETQGQWWLGWYESLRTSELGDWALGWALGEYRVLALSLDSSPWLRPVGG